MKFLENMLATLFSEEFVRSIFMQFGVIHVMKMIICWLGFDTSFLNLQDAVVIIISFMNTMRTIELKKQDLD